MRSTAPTQLIYGRHPVQEALEQGVALEKVMLQSGTRGEFEKTIRRLCKDRSIPMQVVPTARLQRFTKGNHQGVLAFRSLISYESLANVLPLLFEEGHTPLLLLLDGVTDVRNFGAIARSAEVLGVHALVTTQKNTALINAEAIKTSAGALNRLRVCRENSLANTIDLCRMSGLQVLASDLQAAQPITTFDLTLPTALVLGSEGDGISPDTRKRSDHACMIPQQGQTDSLNVSVAAGILLYEVQRQRKG